MVPVAGGACELTLISVPVGRVVITIRNISNTSHTRSLVAVIISAVLFAVSCAASSGFSVAVEDLQATNGLSADAGYELGQAYPTAVFLPLVDDPLVDDPRLDRQEADELAVGSFERALLIGPTPLPTASAPVAPTTTEPVETPTAVPAPTAVPPTSVPATAVPPTVVPPTEVPPTAVPATEVPATPEPEASGDDANLDGGDGGDDGDGTSGDQAEVALSSTTGDATDDTSSVRAVVAQTYAPFAVIDELTLYLPSTRVEHVGFHQAVNVGAQQMTPIDSPVPASELASRGRGTGSHTAADIVVEPGVPIVSPVSGTVLAANTYVLYCEHNDSIVVIEPDGFPGWETKLLHISGLQISVGQRVEAGVTVIASGPTVLPFESQVDGVTSAPAWPHVHIETVDTSIPHEGSTGSCP